MKPRNPSATVTTLIASALAFLAGWSIGTLLQSADPTMVGVALASVVGAVVWTVTRWLSIPRGTAQEKPKEQQWTKLEITMGGGLHGDFVDLPLDRGQLKTMAKSMAIEGLKYNETVSRLRLSRSMAESVRTELMARGYLRWINDNAHQLGVMLTEKGRATMKGLAK
jgi:hypothetical protein